jgi:PPM family protein phosphatase
MHITIYPPKYFWEIGGRNNNEDYLYPYPSEGVESLTSTLFMVCDGVGGAHKGEVASRMACEQIVDYFQKKPTEVSSEIYVRDAVNTVQHYFNSYQTIQPESKGMATTLTLLHLHQAGATVVHMGDSRVYHIRGQEIRYKTKDHNLINDMLAAGTITEAEAIDHPKKNVITRALQAGADADPRPEIKHITDDLKTGDYFFLCSDGVLECVSDEVLCAILSSDMADDAKITKIKDLSAPHSKDNCTAYLVRIQEVNGTISPQHAALLAPLPAYTTSSTTRIEEPTMESNQAPTIREQMPVYMPPPTAAQPSNSLLKYALIGTLMLLLGLGIAYFAMPTSEEVTNPPAPRPSTTYPSNSGSSNSNNHTPSTSSHSHHIPTPSATPNTTPPAQKSEPSANPVDALQKSTQDLNEANTTKKLEELRKGSKIIQNKKPKPAADPDPEKYQDQVPVGPPAPTTPNKPPSGQLQGQTEGGL